MSIFSPIVAKRTHWVIVMLSALAGAVFLTIDLLWDGAPVAPLLGICWLLIISMRVPPPVMARVIAVLVPFVVLSMIGKGWAYGLIQVLVFMCAGGLALLNSASRVRAQRLAAQLRLIVELAPAGLIIADRMGCIVSASKDIKRLLGEQLGPLEGHSFPDVLMSQVPPGEAMRRFNEWFRRDGEHDEQFSLRSCSKVIFGGSVICSGSGADRIIIASVRHLEPIEVQPARS